MKLFFIILVILIAFFIPIPIKISMYYSTSNYYIKIYKFNLISKNKHLNKKNDVLNTRPIIKKERKFLSNFRKEIDYRLLIKTLSNLNLKIKPLLRTNLSINYSLNDAARTAIFYGVLCQLPYLIFILLKNNFNIKKFNLKINPIFVDNFLLKIEGKSIIFLSLANAIYMTFILFRLLNTRR